MKIYVSYRRKDSGAYAGRLMDALERRLGRDAVLRPERLIAGGNWAEEQRKIVRTATLMLVVIGPGWLTAHDEYGRRSVDDPDDFVRNEIADALRREIQIVPVLVGGAHFPEAHALPPDIAGLAMRQGIILSDDGWERDFDRLHEVFNRLGWDLGDSGSRSARSPSRPPAPAPTPAPARYSAPVPPPAPPAEPAPVAATGPDAFISHASEDHALAELIVAGLEKQGHRCWLAPRDIPPGTNSYARAITGAIKTSRLMVVIVSAHANQSDDVLNEITLAKNFKVPRLPVRIDSEPLDDGLAYYFSQSQWLDVPGLSHKEIAQRLVTLVHGRPR
jgi:hypothetical protein